MLYKYNVIQRSSGKKGHTKSKKKKIRGKKSSKIKQQQEIRKERYSIIIILNLSFRSQSINIQSKKSDTLDQLFFWCSESFKCEVFGEEKILKIEDNRFYCVGTGDLEWQRKKQKYLLLLRVKSVSSSNQQEKAYPDELLCLSVEIIWELLHKVS